jgi:GR25 family glycosyltransferase involved in LPS biosynthesis
MIPVYIISLQDSPRYERACRIDRSSSIPISVFRGVSIHNLYIDNDTIYLGHEQIRYNREQCLRFHNRLLSLGEIGCALSHYKLYQTCVIQSLDALLILEDDFEFTESDAQIIEIMNNLPDTNSFDLCYVQTSPPNHFPCVTPYNQYYYRTDRAYARTHGYIITNRFAHEILNTFELHSAADGYLVRKSRSTNSVIYASYQRFVGLSPLAQVSDIDRVSCKFSA